MGIYDGSKRAEKMAEMQNDIERSMVDFFNKALDRTEAMPKIEFADFALQFSRYCEALMKDEKEVRALGIDLCAMACRLVIFGDENLNKLRELGINNFLKSKV